MQKVTLKLNLRLSIPCIFKAHSLVGRSRTDTDADREKRTYHPQTYKTQGKQIIIHA